MAEHKQDGGENHVSGQSNKPTSKPAHALSIENIIAELHANPEVGLNSEEARRRLDEYGPNDFGRDQGVQPVKIFIGQVANAMTLVRHTVTGILNCDRRADVRVAGPRASHDRQFRHSLVD